MPFTRTPATVGDLLASTLELYAAENAEQWYLKSPLTAKFKSGSGIKEVSGGESIVLKVNYQNSGTVSQITRASALPTTQQQMYSTASLSWAGIGGSIVRNDWDMTLNAGVSKQFDLFEQDLKNLEEEMSQSMESLLIGAVTPTSSSIWSLLDIIDSSDPAIADYAGLDRDVYTWWASNEVASGGIANVLESFRTAYNTAGRNGMDPIDFIITTQTVYEAYQARLTAHEQLRQGDKGDLEFPSLAFMGKPVFYSDNMIASTALGVNLKHTKMYVQKGMKMKLENPVRVPGGQDEVRIVRTICQMVCDRPASNFKVTGLS